MDFQFNQSLYYQSNRLARKLSKIAEDAFKPSGLAPTYAYLLMLLDQWKELSLSDISTGLDIDPSTTTRFIDRLLKKELVRRRKEGRYGYISLSPKGISKMPQIRECNDNLEIQITKMFGPKTSNKHTEYLSEIINKIKVFIWRLFILEELWLCSGHNQLNDPFSCGLILYLRKVFEHLVLPLILL